MQHRRGMMEDIEPQGEALETYLQLVLFIVLQDSVNFDEFKTKSLDVLFLSRVWVV
jgi:hypothetical protein